MKIKHLGYLLKDKYQFTESQIRETISKLENDKMDLIPDEILSDIKLIEKGYPLAYVIGYVDFINTKIDLSFKPLIPRPETEFWVEQTLNTLKEETLILDIFAGSGCIGVSILKNVPNTKVIFSDIDPNAINQINLNLELNEIPKSRYKIVETNLFDEIKNNKFDYIFANPPYIGKTDIFEPEIKFEPEIALFTGGNGIKIIKQFLAQAKKQLSEGGAIFMEFGLDQKDDIEKLLISTKYKNWEFKKDQHEIDRWVKIW